jgi:hypothetical protein
LTSNKAIRDKIIELLDADPDLDPIKQWFKGEPVLSKQPAYPWAWVEWTAGRVEAPVGVKQQFLDNFYVVVVDADADPEQAEDKAIDWADLVHATLRNNPTIDDLVAASFVINREKQKLFDSNQRSVVAVRLTLSTRRRE